MPNDIEQTISIIIQAVKNDGISACSVDFVLDYMVKSTRTINALWLLDKKRQEQNGR